MTHHGTAVSGATQGMLFTLVVLVAVGVYLTGVEASRRRGRAWPAIRIVAWMLGCLALGWGVRPLVSAGHDRMFTDHMMTHVLIGMGGPTLLALARPVTLLLRALPQRGARGLAAVLRSTPVRVVTHPVVAAVLDVGGLWLLYTSPLYHAMHASAWVSALVHVHVFLAGYVFAVAILEPEPTAHPVSYPARAAVLVASIAAHDILAKHLYTQDHLGSSPDDVRTGAMLMYYLGDAVEIALIILLCLAWYRSANRPATPTRHHRSSPSRLTETHDGV